MATMEHHQVRRVPVVDDRGAASALFPKQMWRLSRESGSSENLFVKYLAIRKASSDVL